MRFVKASNENRSVRSTLNISSMIDVTFLLLVYFIITTVLTPPEDQLTPALKIEQGAASQIDDFEPQIIAVVTLDAQPVYKLGEQIMTDRAQLARVLAKLPHDPGVIIRVEGSVSVGFAIAAVQEARNAGFERVTYVPAPR